MQTQCANDLLGPKSRRAPGGADKAGADGVYFEGPTDERQLETIGNDFKHVPLATSVLERGGVTPALKASDFQRLGFSMILYPSTVIFQVTWTTETALERLRDGEPMPSRSSKNMDQFEEIMDLEYWKRIEAGQAANPQGE